MIALDSLTYAYPGQEKYPVFEEFSWRVERGESWAVLGPSGCGKSTLLYLLAGLRIPTRGQVLINGAPVNRPRPYTGLILQDYGLLPWATVRQNIELGLRIRKFYGPDGTHAPSEGKSPSGTGFVDHWLDRLGLEDVAEKFPAQLSGGQRQRVAIARTLVLNPDLLLMDEPFSSLDAPTRESLQALTRELCQERELTLIIVTHSIEEAAVLGRKILLLTRAPNRSGKIFENPLCGQAEFQGSQEYLNLCRALRAALEQP